MSKTVLFLSACSVLLLSQFALAQDEDKPWDNAKLQSEVEALKTSVGALTKNLDAINKQVDVINQNTADAAKLSLQLKSELEKFATKDDLQALTTEIYDQNVRHGQILDAISADDQSGNRYLRLDAIMDKSEQARNQMRSAVERSVREYGTLTIVNKVGADRDVVVNGQQYRVMAGATVDIPVKAGTVNTRLPNGEDFNWTIGPGNQYAQSIDIIDRYTTYRPVAGTAAPVASVVTPATYYYNSTPSYYNYNPWGWNGYTYYSY